MLISFLLVPEAFGASAIRSKADRQSAELILGDILDTGVVVDYPGRPTLNEIEKNVDQLQPQLKQRLQILIDEMKVQKKVLFATPADGSLRTREQLVAELKPDAAIVPADGTKIGVVEEVITVEDYPDSRIRKRVGELRSPRVPAAHLDASSLTDLLGRFLKYSRSVTIIDKMIGRSAKDGALKARFTKGVEFVVDCWAQNTVYGMDRLAVEIVTVAGDCGASSGYVDPHATRNAICRAFARVPVTLKVVLKQDGCPGVFHARYLKAHGRCCKLDPGIDALGSNEARCLCLQIDPPSEATSAMVRDILKLPELSHAVE